VKHVHNPLHICNLTETVDCKTKWQICDAFEARKKCFGRDPQDVFKMVSELASTVIEATSGSLPLVGLPDHPDMNAIQSTVTWYGQSKSALCMLNGRVF